MIARLVEFCQSFRKINSILIPISRTLNKLINTNTTTFCRPRSQEELCICRSSKLVKWKRLILWFGTSKIRTRNFTFATNAKPTWLYMKNCSTSMRITIMGSSKIWLMWPRAKSIRSEPIKLWHRFLASVVAQILEESSLLCILRPVLSKLEDS